MGVMFVTLTCASMDICFLSAGQIRPKLFVTALPTRPGGGGGGGNVYSTMGGILQLFFISVSGQFRPVLFVTARVHPGETPASFVCQGLVDWLLGGDPEAVQLRRGATVVVLPMLNPDGVFLGNYRYAPSPLLRPVTPLLRPCPTPPWEQVQVAHIADVFMHVKLLYLGMLKLGFRHT